MAIVSSASTAGAIFVLGRASSSAQVHAMLLFAATGIAVLAIWHGLRTAPALRAWSIGGIVATLVVAVAIGGLRSQPSTIDEDIVRADPPAAAAMEREQPAADGAMMADTDAPAPRNALVARGSFESLEHAGRGTASIIDTSDGRTVLTLTDFETDAGPDLVVWLVAGNPRSDSDVEAGRHVSLGALKGTSGDQQYALPDGVDPAEFTHAYVWCRAFSVGFSRARLA